jgi:hypothetical protein
MNLTELIEQISRSYKQSKIQTRIFDFETIREIESLEPKYFYRGESNSYPNTRTTLVRLLQEGKLKSDELTEYIYVHHNLYLFLREVFFGISCVETTDHGKPNIELFISGILQHYGFDTSFLDITSDLLIAANFASMNDVGSKGKILILESNSLNNDSTNYYFDLTKCLGSRPKVQSSYVIFDQLKNLDLKDKSFLSKHNGIWFDFELTKEDKERFCNTSILSIKNDEVPNQLNEWWNYSASAKQINSSSIKYLLSEKFKSLNMHSIE